MHKLEESSKKRAECLKSEEIHTSLTASTIISSHTKIVGNIISTGEVKVHGSISGDLNARKVIIGRLGNFLGKITTETITISGHFEGEISTNKIEIVGTARVFGKLQQQIITVKDGAVLDLEIKHRK